MPTWCLILLLTLSSLAGCTPHQRPPDLTSPCATHQQAVEWHRQAIESSLCGTLGPAWVADFSQKRGKLVLYVAVDTAGAFYQLERYYISTDSAQFADSGFLRAYQQRLSSRKFCWPAAHGLVENTYDTLRSGERVTLVKRYTIPLFCSPHKPCACP